LNKSFSEQFLLIDFSRLARTRVMPISG